MDATVYWSYEGMALRPVNIHDIIVGATIYFQDTNWNTYWTCKVDKIMPRSIIRILKIDSGELWYQHISKLYVECIMTIVQMESPQDKELRIFHEQEEIELERALNASKFKAVVRTKKRKEYRPQINSKQSKTRLRCRRP